MGSPGWYWGSVCSLVFVFLSEFGLGSPSDVVQNGGRLGRQLMYVLWECMLKFSYVRSCGGVCPLVLWILEPMLIGLRMIWRSACKMNWGLVCQLSGVLRRDWRREGHVTRASWLSRLFCGMGGNEGVPLKKKKKFCSLDSPRITCGRSYVGSRGKGAKWSQKKKKKNWPQDNLWSIFQGIHTLMDPMVSDWLTAAKIWPQDNLWSLFWKYVAFLIANGSLLHWLVDSLWNVLASILDSAKVLGANGLRGFSCPCSSI